MSKVIIATYETRAYFKVPKEWELEDIHMKWSNVYYKGEEVQVPLLEADDIDMKRPDKYEEDNIENYDGFFDCEDEEGDED